MNNFFSWLEEVWEQIEIQIYGIVGAICFFILVYLLFQPYWMRPLIDIFKH